MKSDNDLYRSLILSLIDRISRNTNPSLHRSSIKDRFGFYPTQYLDHYIRALRVAKKNLPKGQCVRFLECGSGLGLMTQIAKSVLTDSRDSEKFHGIDIVTEYVKESIQLWNACGAHRGPLFFEQDILLFDKYTDYNIMFWWTPIKTDLNAVFERKAVNDAKKGTLFIINVTYRNVFMAYELPVKEINLPYTGYGKPIRLFKKI